MPDSIMILCNVLNSLPSSVIVYDALGKIVDANQAACYVHGVDHIADLEKPASAEEAIRKALTGEFCTTEYCIVNKKTGKQRWLKVQCNPVYTTGDTPVGVSLFEKDITSQKELMIELLNMKVSD